MKTEAGTEAGTGAGNKAGNKAGNNVPGETDAPAVETAPARTD